LAKRLTDTDKWKKHWFRRLPSDHKVFWIYLLDQCDHAGIWEVDFELAGYFCGGIDEQEIRNVFSKQFIEFDNQKRWFIKDFIEFQYGTLKNNANIHKSVIQRLKKFDLLSFVEYENDGIMIPSSSDMVKDKRMVKRKDKRKEGENSKKSQLAEINIDSLITEFPGVDVAAEFDKWQDWMLSKGKTYKNYNSAFKNWLRSDWVQKKEVSKKRKLVCPVHEKITAFAERDSIKYCPECRLLMKTEEHIAIDRITA